MYFGGGNKKKFLYEMDAKKKVTRLPDAPEVFSGTRGNLFHDPGTGDILLLSSAAKLYAFDVLGTKGKGGAK